MIPLEVGSQIRNRRYCFQLLENIKFSGFRINVSYASTFVLLILRINLLMNALLSRQANAIYSDILLCTVFVYVCGSWKTCQK